MRPGFSQRGGFCPLWGVQLAGCVCNSQAQCNPYGTLQAGTRCFPGSRTDKGPGPCLLCRARRTDRLERFQKSGHRPGGALDHRRTAVGPHILGAGDDRAATAAALREALVQVGHRYGDESLGRQIGIFAAGVANAGDGLARLRLAHGVVGLIAHRHFGRRPGGDARIEIPQRRGVGYRQVDPANGPNGPFAPGFCYCGSPRLVLLPSPPSTGVRGERSARPRRAAKRRIPPTVVHRSLTVTVFTSV